MPSAVLNAHHGESAITAAAATPAQRPPRRVASVNAPASASSPPARATISQSAGAASPKSASGVVNRTGNGFHDGPLDVSSASRPVSLPHTTHAQGSNASAHGRSSDSAPSTSAATTSTAPPRVRLVNSGRHRDEDHERDAERGDHEGGHDPYRPQAPR